MGISSSSSAVAKVTAMEVTLVEKAIVFCSQQYRQIKKLHPKQNRKYRVDSKCAS